MVLKSKLIQEWVEKGFKPSKDFEFFTKRDYLVIGKLKNQPALAEYECPFCGFYEMKHIEMVKGVRKFKPPRFNCSKCRKPIVVESLRKKTK